jgi:hypothetical protein
MVEKPPLGKILFGFEGAKLGYFRKKIFGKNKCN